MVVAIEGIVVKKEPTFVILKTNFGLSYGISISLFCSAKIEKGQKCELLITQIIKEDSHKFYGFLEKDEQKIFEMLLKVNGIGASIAMTVCSSLETNAFYKTLQQNDDSLLQKVPGIGPKSAKRILVELADAKIGFENVEDDKSQALAALLSLGFKKEKILPALRECKGANTSDLIKEALKKLA